MPFVRVVSFEGVPKERVEEIKREMEGGEQPEGVPATEVLMLHDPDADKAVVVLFFDTEDDYRSGDEVLNAMPAGDTPGRRTSVAQVRRRPAHERCEALTRPGLGGPPPASGALAPPAVAVPVQAVAVRLRPPGPGVRCPRSPGRTR